MEQELTSIITVDTSSPMVGTNCLICGSFIPIIDPSDAYPRICEECKKRLKKLLYEQPEYVPPYQLSVAADVIEELQKPHWIPVTEQLPETDEKVLIYLWNNSEPYIAWVDQEGRWKTDDFYVDKDYLPKAWLPLPKPYEPLKEK